MKNVKIVIGANFGDEGKRLMTDYFCSQFPSHEKVLNIRFMQDKDEPIDFVGKQTGF